ncbi:hypothetical protein FHW96_001664 [Novosphingobium sp. SG751A]|uniref:hypothetical protein n=1 Tax=Novosphingobium sp. SG751A TaxID=2587000 RepID=UPI0015568641|nr:hypothetical protein [Novosphingobium sp. SG751A]NOW45509.1 hypothetical protein [Novosphingobium sp. SG751A]
MRNGSGLVIGFIAVVGLTLVGNHFAQRIYPTFESDKFSKQLGYGCIVRLIMIAAILGFIVISEILFG